MHINYSYREITGLTATLKILLWLGIAMAVIALVSSWAQLELLNQGSFSQRAAVANDARQQTLGLLQSALLVVSIIVFARWIYRANQNVRALGAIGLRVTPGWAVGYFFVPIVNWWKPYQAMKELWQASHNPTVWRDITPASILPLWWTLWILDNITTYMSFKATMSAQRLDTLQVTTVLQMIADAVDIPLYITAITLVSQICRAQEATRESPKQAPLLSHPSAHQVGTLSSATTTRQEPTPQCNICGERIVLSGFTAHMAIHKAEQSQQGERTPNPEHIPVIASQPSTSQDVPSPTSQPNISAGQIDAGSFETTTPTERTQRQRTQDDEEQQRAKEEGDQTAPTLIVSKLPSERYHTISEAIKDAQPGARILVRPGLYNEGLVIDEPLEIIGDGSREEITIESALSPCLLMQTNQAVIRGLTLRGLSRLDPTVSITQGRLVLEDCDITSDSPACVIINGLTANPTIRRCQIRNGRRGIVFTKKSQGLVENCDIFGNIFLGVQIMAGSSPVIRRCQIHEGKGSGLCADNKSQGMVEDCEIFGNSHPIHLSGSSRLVIRGGSIRDKIVKGEDWDAVEKGARVGAIFLASVGVLIGGIEKEVGAAIGLAILGTILGAIIGAILGTLVRIFSPASTT